jgi:cytochrome c-type biogenesis protein CcmH/NrfG
MGDAYLNLDKRYEARIAFENALRLDPDDRKAKRGLMIIEDFRDISF